MTKLTAASLRLGSCDFGANECKQVKKLLIHEFYILSTIEMAEKYFQIKITANVCAFKRFEIHTLKRDSKTHDLLQISAAIFLYA